MRDRLQAGGEAEVYIYNGRIKTVGGRGYCIANQ